MKRTTSILAILGLCLSMGCANTEPGGSDSSGFGFNCETATKAYQTYLASQIIREPTEDEVKYAQAAALFLSMTCGYVPPAMPKGARAKAKPVDSNGVLVLIPPK